MPWGRREAAASRSGVLARAQPDPWWGRIDNGPNWSNAKHRSGKALATCSIRSSLASKSGSVDSFQVRLSSSSLKGDVVVAQHLAQPFPADPHPPAWHPLQSETGLDVLVGPGQVGAQLPHAPAGERQSEGLGPGCGRRDDERDVLVIDQAGDGLPPTEGPGHATPDR